MSSQAAGTIRRSVARLGVAAGLLLAVAGCDDDPLGPVCTAEAVFGINLTVHDGTGGPAADGALGVAIEGAYADTLVILTPSTMAGAVERPGTYDITVSKFGYATWSATNVTVAADECHVIPVSMEANLIPVP